MLPLTDEKFILDATARFRMMWENKNHPNCLYVDERPGVNPDKVADYQDLNFLADKSFKLIIFDPPHRIQKHCSPSFMERYGNQLTPETWQSELKKAFTELWRVLADYGVLIFKWTDHDINVKRVRQVFPVPPLVHHELLGSGRRIHQTRSVWFCFMKIPEEVKP